MPIYCTSMPSPIGELIIAVNDDGALCVLEFADPDQPGQIARGHIKRLGEMQSDEVKCAVVVAQLDEYFQGQRKEFELELAPRGTGFQQLVWQELTAIRFGDTATYGDIARRLGDEKLSRAVGAANGDNPISIVIPCHRVIGAGGKLTGYAGGLQAKRWLLTHEGAITPGLFRD